MFALALVYLTRTRTSRIQEVQKTNTLTSNQESSKLSAKNVITTLKILCESPSRVVPPTLHRNQCNQHNGLKTEQHYDSR